MPNRGCVFEDKAGQGRKGGLPENYIHFSKYVTKKLKEAFGGRSFGTLRKSKKFSKRK